MSISEAGAETGARGAVQGVPHAALWQGLGASPARIPTAYLYDARGCALFDAITRQPAYYLTGTEMDLLQRHGSDIARRVGACQSLIELGAGRCEKVRRLLGALQPRYFVGVDIAGAVVRAAVQRLVEDFPGLRGVALEADITAPVRLPAQIAPQGRLVFYPGSSIGNFNPCEALALLGQMRVLAGEGGGLLIGIDLPKDRSLLEAAYNDAAGITAAFNRNVLRHVNRCIGSDFVPSQWAHVAFYQPAQARVQMHLQARALQRVRWPGGGRDFACGERIQTENSYKYPLPLFMLMLAQAGFQRCRAWTDERDWFALIHARC